MDCIVTRSEDALAAGFPRVAKESPDRILS